MRGYVREGRLKAVRIGKQYRISHDDLEAFVGAPVEQDPRVRRERHVEVSGIIEIDAISPDTASRVSTLLELDARHAHRGEEPLRVETAYDEARGRMKVIILGGLADTARLLDYVQAVLDS